MNPNEGMNAMSRKTNTQSRETPTIVLKTIIDDIARQSNITLDAKKVRAKLRATPTMRDIHTHNASWIFTQSQYDVVRAMFDPKFAQRQKRASKRNASSRVKSNAQSRDAANVSNDTPNVEPSNVD